MMNTETLNQIIVDLKFFSNDEILNWLRRKREEYYKKLDIARNELFDFVTENQSIDLNHSQDYNKLLRTVNNYNSAIDQMDKMIADLNWQINVEGK